MSIVTLNGVALYEDGDMAVHHARRHGLPAFEPESHAAWLLHLKPDHLAVDVGAYTGIYAISAALRGVDCFAFEPNPDVRERLVENCALNKAGVHIMPFALSDSAGGATLYVSAVPLTSGGSLGKAEANRMPVRVDTLTLDESIPKKPVSVIKIDAEGHELKVLSGARKTLKAHKPFLITEALTPEELLKQYDFLRAYGYGTPTKADDFNYMWSAL